MTIYAGGRKKRALGELEGSESEEDFLKERKGGPTSRRACATARGLSKRSKKIKKKGRQSYSKKKKRGEKEKMQRKREGIRKMKKKKNRPTICRETIGLHGGQ